MGSPASGETCCGHTEDAPNMFPIYWVPQRVGSQYVKPEFWNDTVFPIYWVPQRVGSPLPASVLFSKKLRRFQFIGFPSEWGVYADDYNCGGLKLFPIYWVPQRVGSQYVKPEFWNDTVFPIYWVPQRVGSRIRKCAHQALSLFPIYWVPQRVGSKAEEICTAPKSNRFQFIGFPSEWGE